MTLNQRGVVEVLTASGCGRCQKAKSLVKDVINEFNNADIQYREINVVEEIDYAVSLGILSTPAITLNRELVFTALPSKAKLRQAIRERLGNRRFMYAATWMQLGGVGGLGAALMAGFLFSFPPVPLASIPVALA